MNLLSHRLLTRVEFPTDANSGVVVERESSLATLRFVFQILEIFFILAISSPCNGQGGFY